MSDENDFLFDKYGSYLDGLPKDVISDISKDSLKKYINNVNKVANKYSKQH